MSEIAIELRRKHERWALGQKGPQILLDAAAEIERLQRIIDSRPAINASLPGSYIDWSQSIYVMEFHHATASPS